MKQLYISFVDLSTNLNNKTLLISNSWQNILREKTKITEIEICKSKNGKPHILSPPGWHFNISHSKNLAVSVLSEEPVGIDLEIISAHRTTSSISREYYTEKEMDLCSRNKDLFYYIWTRKEAWIKLNDKTVWHMKDSPELIAARKSILTWTVCQGMFRYAMTIALNVDFETSCSWYNSQHLEITRVHNLSP